MFHINPKKQVYIKSNGYINPIINKRQLTLALLIFIHKEVDPAPHTVRRSGAVTRILARIVTV